jgi:hypothetical protein
MEKILGTIATVGFLLAWFYVLQHGVELHEKYECTKWEKQSVEYSGFYWTDWQLAQCNK